MAWKSRAGNCESLIFVSWRQSTSGCTDSIHTTTPGIRALTELTFQVANSTAANLGPAEGLHRSVPGPLDAPVGGLPRVITTDRLAFCERRPLPGTPRSQHLARRRDARAVPRRPDVGEHQLAGVLRRLQAAARHGCLEGRATARRTGRGPARDPGAHRAGARPRPLPGARATRGG